MILLNIRVRCLINNHILHPMTYRYWVLLVLMNTCSGHITKPGCFSLVWDGALLIFRSECWCGAQTVKPLKTVIGENKVAIWFDSLFHYVKDISFSFFWYSFLVAMMRFDVKCCGNMQYIKVKRFIIFTVSMICYQLPVFCLQRNFWWSLFIILCLRFI